MTPSCRPMAAPRSPGTRSRPNLPASSTPLPPQQVATEILTFARNFWSTAEPAWRLKLAEARHLTVRGGLAALAAAGHPALPDELAIRIADRFSAYREEEMFVFPGAHDAIDALKTLGVKLALVTNGAADTQRAKVERFELAHRFDHIQIEGEHGFGKPEERAYHACHGGARRHRRRDLDDRRQSGMGGRGAAASRHLRDLDGCAWRGPAARDRPSSPIASSVRSANYCQPNPQSDGRVSVNAAALIHPAQSLRHQKVRRPVRPARYLHWVTFSNLSLRASSEYDAAAKCGRSCASSRRVASGLPRVSLTGCSPALSPQFATA